MYYTEKKLKTEKKVVKIDAFVITAVAKIPNWKVCHQMEKFESDFSKIQTLKSLKVGHQIAFFMQNSALKVNSSLEHLAKKKKKRIEKNLEKSNY